MRSPWVRTVAGLLLAVALGLPPPVGAQEIRVEEIRLEREDGVLWLSQVPDVLTTEDIRQHLDSGLTSTFALRAVIQAGRQRVEAEGWIAVRYDLWDEVYLVASRGVFGDRRWEIASFDELVRWWQTPRARLPTGDLRPSEPWQVRIDMDLIPFSSAEERDAQRWVSESLRHPERKATESVSESAEDGPEPLSNVLNLLLATSVRRRPVATWRWTATLPGDPSGDPP